MHPSDPWRTALLLIEQYGEMAQGHTMQRAIDLHDVGDREGEAAWLRVFDCVRELQQGTSPPDDVKH